MGKARSHDLTNGRAGQLMSSSIVNYVFRQNRLATAHEGKTNENLFVICRREICIQSVWHETQRAFNWT
jgi:hypothetical protein